MNKNLLLLLALALLLAACSPAVKEDAAAAPDAVPAVLVAENVSARAITKGPGHHWFGYYDKLEFDPSGRYVLGMETAFENRSPEPDDVIKVGMVDLEDGDRWIELGESRAWNWQQGCMLQFLPGSASQVIWNDREGEQFVSHVMDIHTREKRTLPFPVYTLSPDGKTALSVDFERINDMRPGYGYAGPPDPFAEQIAPEDGGIYLGDLISGEKKLIVSLAQMNRRPLPADDEDPAFQDFYTGKNWFNHLLFSPDGSRFIFLHRWKASSKSGVGGFGTLMYTSDLEGKDIRLVDASGFTSHFIWKDADADSILAWTRHASHGDGFYLFGDNDSQAARIIGKDVMTRNGHCTYLPGNEWILNDTYPDDKRLQHVYLYHLATGRRIPLADCLLDPKYKGEWRVDTHPRFSPDGTKVVIDCPDGAAGRQLWLLEIAGAMR